MLPLGYLGKGFGHERQTNFTKAEQRTMMTLWCMFRSPLMVGAELTKLDDWTLSLLTNQELLDMMKESCHGTQILRSDDMAVWKNRDEESGKICVALFNLSDEAAEISVSLSELDEEFGTEEPALHELWDKTESTAAEQKVTAVVEAHGVKVYRIA